jgi:hypothetical protein
VIVLKCYHWSISNDVDDSQAVSCIVLLKYNLEKGEKYNININIHS